METPNSLNLLLFKPVTTTATNRPTDHQNHGAKPTPVLFQSFPTRNQNTNYITMLTRTHKLYVLFPFPHPNLSIVLRSPTSHSFINPRLLAATSFQMVQKTPTNQTARMLRACRAIQRAENGAVSVVPVNRTNGHDSGR
eukprot:TRINITY_DN24675_c0_g1_i1.p1 TRINITY_DN24675_c0_g1~~TRINITY_DN24675_c0_g1_i1.p1  ORF type:complete len:139 (-),score=10.23 TRINITY_DN24675_c0_g1_i1:308-724(-)